MDDHQIVVDGCRGCWNEIEYRTSGLEQPASDRLQLEEQYPGEFVQVPTEMIV
jgi:hypothetical protein